MEWHPLELPAARRDSLERPSPASTIVLPVTASVPYRVRIRLLNLLHAPLEAETRVIINDGRLPSSLNKALPPEVTLSAMADPADEPGARCAFGWR